MWVWVDEGVGKGNPRRKDTRKMESVNLMGRALGKTVQCAETVGSEGRHN